MTSPIELDKLQLAVRSVIELARLPHEDPDDILTGSDLLVAQRGRLLERQHLALEDISFSLSIFCWWPFKPVIADDLCSRVAEARWPLFVGLRDKPNPDRFDSIPSEILSLSHSDLYAQLEKDAATFWSSWLV